MMKIGERIKILRKKNDLTQEKLADYLCVSYQAVSKWECGLTSPDLSLIGPLTKLLHVTADELLGITTPENDTRCSEIETSYRDTFITGDLDERYQVSLKAVNEFPGEMKYLDWLAWAEAMRSFSFENDEVYKAEQEKAIKHFASVIENTDNERIKASSIQGIVQYLSFRGRFEEAKEYALLYPENYSVNKDDVLLSCLHGNEKTIHCQKMLDNRLTDILNLVGNQSLLACTAQEQILNALIPDGNYMYYHVFLADNYLNRAKFYANQGDCDKSVQMLETAHSHAVKYDEFLSQNQTYYFTSSFFDKVEHNTAEISRTGTTTQEEDFYEALNRAPFNLICNCEKFIQIKSRQPKH